MSLRKKLFAWILKNGDSFNHRIYGRYKKELFKNIDGVIVEVGPGSGVNFVYFPKDIRWLGIEPNVAFHTELQKKASECRITATLLSGDATHIPLPDCHADAVVCTLVLCSVPDAARAVTEMKRILKPGGRLIFIEHVAAPLHTRLRSIQNFSNPFNRFMADGCNCNRETWKVIEEAGFVQVNLRHEKLKGSLFIHAPHVMGVAVK